MIKLVYTKTPTIFYIYNCKHD